MRVKRRYHSPRRTQQAQATRRRIAEAALRLFAKQGYAATKMQAVARSAKVAIDTVYAAYGSKAGVLEAAIRIGETAGAGVQRFDEIALMDEPRAVLELVAAVYRLLAHRLGPLLEALRQGTGDAAVAHLWREGEARRLADMQQAADRLAALGALRPELDPDAAAAILWALTGVDTHRYLVLERKWSLDRLEAWLVDALADLLIRPAQNRPRRATGVPR